MSFCKKQISIISLGIAGLIFVLVVFLLNSPYPSTTGLETDVNALKDLIGWGLKRQTTHAALTLSAIVSLFSLLRLRPNILQGNETRLAFLVFLGFLAYEYSKLIRSFQTISIYEDMLLNISNKTNVFPHDPFQSLFFGCSIIHVIGQALLIAIVTMLMTRIYNIASANTRALSVASDESSSALEVARMRLARGEITSEEFDEIKRARAVS